MNSNSSSSSNSYRYLNTRTSNYKENSLYSNSYSSSSSYGVAIGVEDSNITVGRGNDLIDINISGGEKAVGLKKVMLLTGSGSDDLNITVESNGGISTTSSYLSNRLWAGFEKNLYSNFNEYTYFQQSSYQDQYSSSDYKYISYGKNLYAGRNENDIDIQKDFYASRYEYFENTGM